MSSTYSIGDILDIRVEKIVPRGFGIGFAEKLTVLIPLSVPGDELRVEIRDLKKRLAFAEIVEIIRPAPQRITPPCVYVGACGGCDFQQMTYAAQLQSKIDIIRDCLQRIGKIEFTAEIPMIASPAEFGYRSRARWQVESEGHSLGYFRRDSHEVIDITGCPILTRGLGSTLQNVRENIVWNGRYELEAATGDDDQVSIYSLGGGEPASELAYSVNGETYTFSARTFFQANKFLIGDLIETAVGGASGDVAFDLYCGVGLFSLPMARQFKQVVAVEGHPDAVVFAKKNAEGAGLSNLKISSKSVSRFMAENKTRNVDFVLIDPPRSGTERTTLTAIAALQPGAISYVSCDPSILARDLRTLLDAGYLIESITALDLFPQTHHVETVVRLNRA